jgi:hypothetical protein
MIFRTGLELHTNHRLKVGGRRRDQRECGHIVCALDKAAMLNIRTPSASPQTETRFSSDTLASTFISSRVSSGGFVVCDSLVGSHRPIHTQSSGMLVLLKYVSSRGHKSHDVARPPLFGSSFVQLVPEWAPCGLWLVPLRVQGLPILGSLQVPIGPACCWWPPPKPLRPQGTVAHLRTPANLTPAAH